MLERFDDGLFFCVDHVEQAILEEVTRIEEEIEATETELTRNVLNGQVSALKKVLIRIIGEDE